MDGKDATVTIPMQFDKAVRNLASQTLVIEIEASAVEKVEVSALLDVSSLGGSAIFNNNSEATVKQFEVPVARLRQNTQLTLDVSSRLEGALFKLHKLTLRLRR